MPTSSRIIRSTVIEASKFIPPPSHEHIMIKVSENSDENHSIKDIYEKIALEANELKTQALKDAEIKSKQIISDAIKEVAILKKSAKEDGFQQGYKEGYQEGYDFGMNEANKSASEILMTANNYLQSCQIEAARYIEEKKKEIIALSIEIAKRVVNNELATSTEVIFKMAESLLSKAIDKKQVVLKVNPQDFNLIKNRREELAIYVEDISNLLIIADAAIKKGSIKAETSTGYLDGDIDSQLDLVLKKLLEG